MIVTDVIFPASNAPIGWLGGKTKLCPTILTCTPDHNCYCEVFCGSAIVFFGKPPSMSKIEFINDINGELVNLMKVLAGTYFDPGVLEEFVTYVRNMPASRAAYEDWKGWSDEQVAQLTPAQRAFRFYYCVKKGFSSHPKGGYEASPLSKSRYNQNTDFEKFAERFRVNNAQIENLHYATFIEKYNRASAKTHFYADPPYFIATNNSSYYQFNFDEKDHQKFKECCDEIDKNKNTFMISYDDVPEVLDLYKDYFIYRTDPIVYSCSDERDDRNLEKTELIITNYDVAELLISRNKSKKKRDLFAKTTQFDPNDKKIEIAECIGLEHIN